MSRHGDTKDEIVRLISRGENTLSRISEALNLAPSTVSKHIHDLEAEGRIEQVNNDHVKKWKYYQVSGTAREIDQYSRPMMNKSTFVSRGIFIVAIIGIIAAALLYMHPANSTGIAGSANGTQYVPISITDPPQVPNGTQALYINYSSLSVGVISEGSFEWIPVNSNGRLDLMSLINESQVIGELGLNPNYTVEKVRFNVSETSITIKNITYPVYMQNSQVVADVTGNGMLNSTSGIFLDFSPVVSEAYANNSTIYVMLPSISAVIAPYSNLHPKQQYGWSGHTPPGGQVSPPGSQPRPPFHSPENISVTGAVISKSWNATSLNVTVSNNGNSSVVVLGMVISTNAPQVMIPNMQHQRFPYRQNGSTLIINASTICARPFAWHANSTVRLPQPAVNFSVLGNCMPQPTFFPVRFYSAMLVVDANGTLSSPMPFNYGRERTQIGYTLDAHDSKTFTYTGDIYSGELVPWMNFTSSGTYKLTVVTNRGIINTVVNSST